ncbi:MAG: glycosyltransferase, partial [Muribaculaceae bacterium]|nr:glycosyltransferase [Muribaculaceae bacterium]
KPFLLSWVDGSLANPKSVEGQPDDALKLIYIGMAKGRPHKGLRQLIDAMTILRGKPVTLTVIGSADDADIAAAPESVTFLGPRRDAVDFIPTHDMLMLTSTRDASPRVVREAQACGVPCVVTDIPGARDLIAPGRTGLLVAPGSAEAIAGAISHALGDPAGRAAMAAETRRFIADNFSFEKYVKYYTDLFITICSK